MGVCEAESKIPRLSLLNPPTIMHSSPERSGMITPPLHTSASIPFGWEEEPGKPRPCTTLVSFSNPTPKKCLELPPRLLIDSISTKLTKLPSPTTVLSGPYIGSSNRMSKDCYGSFGVERGQLGTMVLSNRGNDHIGSTRGSHKNVRMRKVEHYGRFTNPFHAKSRVWTKICEGWKRVVPWRSEKLKKYQCWWP